MTRSILDIGEERPLRTRIDGEETRFEMMEYLKRFWMENSLPPRIRDFAIELDMSTSHVIHHLRVLERQGLIRVRHDLGRAEPIPVGMVVSCES